MNEEIMIYDEVEGERLAIADITCKNKRKFETLDLMYAAIQLAEKLQLLQYNHNDPSMSTM